MNFIRIPHVTRNLTLRDPKFTLVARTSPNLDFEVCLYFAGEWDAKAPDEPKRFRAILRTASAQVLEMILGLVTQFPDVEMMLDWLAARAGFMDAPEGVSLDLDKIAQYAAMKSNPQNSNLLIPWSWMKDPRFALYAYRQADDFILRVSSAREVAGSLYTFQTRRHSTMMAASFVLAQCPDLPLAAGHLARMANVPAQGGPINLDAMGRN